MIMRFSEWVPSQVVGMQQCNKGCPSPCLTVRRLLVLLRDTHVIVRSVQSSSLVCSILISGELEGYAQHMTPKLRIYCIDIRIFYIFLYIMCRQKHAHDAYVCIPILRVVGQVRKHLVGRPRLLVRGRMMIFSFKGGAPQKWCWSKKHFKNIC